MEGLTGYAHREVQDLDAWVCSVYPDDTYRNEFKKFINDYRLREVDFARDLFMITRKDGETRYVEFSVYDMNNNVYPEVLQVVQGLDVTEIKLSEERLKLIFELAPDAYYLNDFKGNFIEGNRAAEELTGYRKDELIGQSLLKLNLLKRSQIPKAAKLLGLNVLGKSTGPDEFVLNRKDGTSVFVEISTHPVKINGYGLVLGIARDISRRKEIERENKQLEATLQRAEKMETIGKLAGGVAHDLNNVLTALVGYPDLLLAQLPENSPFLKPLLTMQKSGMKAAAIVQDLLTLARRGVPSIKVLNVNDIINDYFKSLEFERLVTFHPHVQIERNLDPDLMNILGSPVHIFKLTMNLISNAVEALASSGMVTISTKTLKLSAPLKGYETIKKGQYCVLTVSDSGVGMNKADLQNIFEPFYTKKKMGRSGTGLGMTVVWNTVKDHNGYIDVISQARKGTTIKIYLPTTQKEKQRKKFTPTDEYQGNGEKVLVVDDMFEQREIVSKFLEKLGYEAHTVPGGEEALKFLIKDPVDLLILDMIMDPGIDGYETYKRALDINPKQKAIIVSGYSETKKVLKAQALGAGEFIKKPYTIDKLGIAIKNVLNN
jgi:PAS domain S-box-containing protein